MGQLISGDVAVLERADEFSESFRQICLLEPLSLLEQFERFFERAPAGAVEIECRSPLKVEPVVIPGQGKKIQDAQQQDECDGDIRGSGKPPRVETVELDCSCVFRRAMDLEFDPGRFFGVSDKPVRGFQLIVSTGLGIDLGGNALQGLREPARAVFAVARA